MTAAIWLIRIGVALTMMIFGLNQMVKPEVWFHYVPEFMKKTSPISPALQMRVHALGNIVFGLFLIAGSFHPLIAAWVALVWWITILPFTFKVKWDIGMRDLSIIFSLVSLIALLHIH